MCLLCFCVRYLFSFLKQKSKLKEIMMGAVTIPVLCLGLLFCNVFVPVCIALFVPLINPVCLHDN